MGDMTPDTFGKRALVARMLLSAAEERQVTQREIATALGISNVTVYRWECGDSIPGIATIEALARELNVSAAWLAFGIEPR
jgi:transcriptional regulator with XRE-family HTH domain